jgi:cytochrome c biogenesis protein CcmG/thiol:disulfide interchange protein DsbE
MNPVGRRLMFLAPLALLGIGGVGAFTLLKRMAEGDFDPRGVPSMLIDKKVPDFTLAAQSGQAGFSAADLAGAGQPVLVNFFASWCLPCVAEAAQLLALKQRGVALWGIAYKDRDEETARFLKQHGNPFARIGRDAEGKAALEFGVYGVPETYLVDRAGIVRWRWVGALTDVVVARALNPLLKQYA